MLPPPARCGRQRRYFSARPRRRRSPSLPGGSDESALCLSGAVVPEGGRRGDGPGGSETDVEGLETQNRTEEPRLQGVSSAGCRRRLAREAAARFPGRQPMSNKREGRRQGQFNSLVPRKPALPSPNPVRHLREAKCAKHASTGPACPLTMPFGAASRMPPPTAPTTPARASFRLLDTISLLGIQRPRCRVAIGCPRNRTVAWARTWSPRGHVRSPFPVFC